MDKKIEILAPAGSYESLKAAIAAGADAVYVGGSQFGARAYAENFQEEQLLEAIDYVHLHGKKIYLTINTLVKEKELQNELYAYLLPYYKQGIDAVIVQDIGVLEFIKEKFPDLPIHASTQMTITNRLGAEFLEKLGVERVVTAREMQLHEIKEIAENTNLEIESFVHGALCYCYSGQCLFSSLIGGRSGNRGQCAQPCRLPYKINNNKDNQYILSLKDICTLENIPELIKAGICSFKIEGRMKKPEYVALVTSMYRKYVDLYLEKKTSFYVDAKDREMLMDLYNRGGFHEGYYHTKNGRDMLSINRPNHAGVPALKITGQNGKNVMATALVHIHRGDIIELPDGENYTFGNDTPAGQKVSIHLQRKTFLQQGLVLNRTRNEHLLREVHETIIQQKPKVKVNGRLVLHVGQPAKLVLSYQDILVEVIGDETQEAINQPLDIERIKKQIKKTGNTDFEFDELSIDLKGNVFMPMQNLNELRRTALEKLYARILMPYRREEILQSMVALDNTNQIESKQPMMHVYVEKIEQFEEAISFRQIHRIYVDCNAIDRIWTNENISALIKKAQDYGKEVYLAMPHIFRKDSIEKYAQNYERIFDNQWNGILVRNYESYAFLEQHNYEKNIVTDHNLYQFNQYAKSFWENRNVESITAALELNFKELQEVGLNKSELIVYGYLPMMISAQCIAKSCDECQKIKREMTIQDRYQKRFTVKNFCDYCYNIIYNTLPLVLIDQKQEINVLKPKAIRLHFTMEDRKTMKHILQLYEDVFYKDAAQHHVDMEFTRGHFKRGIK